MTDSYAELIGRVKLLAVAECDDLSIALEAADALEQAQVRIRELEGQLKVERSLSDSLKSASRMPGLGSYVDWIKQIRSAYDQNPALALQVETMREALEYGRGAAEDLCRDFAIDICDNALALSAAPASEVLAEFEKKVIERCVEVVKAEVRKWRAGTDPHRTAVDCLKAVSALIAAPKESSNEL